MRASSSLHFCSSGAKQTDKCCVFSTAFVAKRRANRAILRYLANKKNDGTKYVTLMRCNEANTRANTTPALTLHAHCTGHDKRVASHARHKLTNNVLHYVSCALPVAPLCFLASPFSEYLAHVDHSNDARRSAHCIQKSKNKERM